MGGSRGREVHRAFCRSFAIPIGSILGGLISQGGATAAGNAASAAGSQALSNSYDVGNRDVARLSPWIASGSAASQQINALLGLGKLGPIGDKYNTYGTTDGNWQQDQKDAMARFQTDPGYQFRMQEGVNALNRSGAARGMTLSGAQTKALDNYGQGQGSQEFGNYFSRLQGTSALGENASSAANSAYNTALVPGIAQNFQGQVRAGDDYAQGSNALAAGIKGGINSLVSLAAYGGDGGGFGLPNFGTGSSDLRGSSYTWGPGEAQRFATGYA